MVMTRGRGGICGVSVVAECRLGSCGCLGVEVGAQVRLFCRDEPHHPSSAGAQLLPKSSAGGMSTNETAVHYVLPLGSQARRN